MIILIFSEYFVKIKDNVTGNNWNNMFFELMRVRNEIIIKLLEIVITMDKIDYSQNGIIHKNIIDFLLEY